MIGTYKQIEYRKRISLVKAELASKQKQLEYKENEVQRLQDLITEHEDDHIKIHILNEQLNINNSAESKKEQSVAN